MIIGFNTGEAIRNEIVPPNGAPLLNKPTRIGIVEHEQKGVIAPKAAPIMFCIRLWGFDSTLLIVSAEIYRWSNATIKLIIIKRRISSVKINLKKSHATARLFTLNIFLTS